MTVESLPGYEKRSIGGRHIVESWYLTDGKPGLKHFYAQCSTERYDNKTLYPYREGDRVGPLTDRAEAEQDAVSLYVLMLTERIRADQERLNASSSDLIAIRKFAVSRERSIDGHAITRRGPCRT